MKSTQPATRRSCPVKIAAATLLAAILAATSSASTLYWGTTGTADWATPGNWYTDAAGLTPSGAAPTSDDDLIFNTSSLDAAVTVRFTATHAAKSLTFDNTFATSFGTNGSGKILTLGSGGITLNSGAGNAIIGGSGSGSVSLQMTAGQTWTNNAASTIEIKNALSATTANATTTLTINSASSGGTYIGFTIGDGANSAKLALVVDSTGTGVTTLNGVVHSGGTTIKSGILAINDTKLGTGEVLLGNTTGSANATLRLLKNTTTGTNTNLLTVQAGNTGTNTLNFTANGGGWSGDIALDNTLTVTTNASVTATLSGIISGDGDLVKAATSGNHGVLILSGANTYSGDTTINAGTFTLADAGALTFYIGDDGVSNSVSGTGTANFNGSFIFDVSGANLTDGNSWNIVSVGTLLESFTGTFDVQGFTDTDGDNIWTNGGWSFDEAFGVLSYSAVPEPSTYAFFTGAVMLIFTGVRRKLRVRPTA